MSWNHRVIKSTFPSDETAFGIYEVYYNSDGTIYAHTMEPCRVVCENIDDLKEYLQWMMNCIDKPILEKDKIVFVDYNKDDETEEDISDEEFYDNNV